MSKFKFLAEIADDFLCTPPESFSLFQTERDGHTLKVKQFRMVSKIMGLSIWNSNIATLGPTLKSQLS
jgi:hypothetical protein